MTKKGGGMKGFRTLRLGKVKILIIGTCLIVYKENEKYQKWLFKTILKNNNNQYYSFNTIYIKGYDVRIFDLKEFDYDDNKFTLIIQDKNYETIFYFELIKHNNKFYIKPLKKE